MKKSDVEKLVKYWRATADHDYETMLGLFKIKRYCDALFFGHIIMEKILKACVVKNTGSQAPRMHDLVRLQELARIEVSRKEKDFLYKVNEFNLRTRYPDYRLNFYKQCTKGYAKSQIDRIKELYAKLCQEVMQKK